MRHPLTRLLDALGSHVQNSLFCQLRLVIHQGAGNRTVFFGVIRSEARHLLAQVLTDDSAYNVFTRLQ